MREDEGETRESGCKRNTEEQEVKGAITFVPKCWNVGNHGFDVMWGDKDPLIPVSIGRRFDALLPNSALVVYENVGHIPMEEVPARSAADVRAFLGGL